MAGLEKIVSQMAFWVSQEYSYNQIQQVTIKKGLPYRNTPTDYGKVKSFIIFQAYQKGFTRPDLRVYVIALLNIEEAYEQEETRSCIIVAVRDNNIHYVTFTQHRNVPSVLSRVFNTLSINNAQGAYWFVMDENVPNTFAKAYKEHIVAVIMHNVDVLWSKQ